MSAWETPRRYLLVYMQRSGSTFLAHCLDSHPDIGAERGEPLHPEHTWRRFLPDVNEETLLDLVLRRPGYKVTVARANYRHTMEIPTGFLRDLDGLIFLYRENVVRNMISSHINARGIKAVHAFEPQPVERIHIDPNDFLRGCRRSDAKQAETLAWLEQFPCPFLVTTYAAITGGEGIDAGGVAEPEGARLCEFLGVESRPLVCSLRKINPQPAVELVANWPDVKAVLLESEYRECLQSI